MAQGGGALNKVRHAYHHAKVTFVLEVWGFPSGSGPTGSRKPHREPVHCPAVQRASIPSSSSIPTRHGNVSRALRSPSTPYRHLSRYAHRHSLVLATRRFGPFNTLLFRPPVCKQVYHEPENGPCGTKHTFCSDCFVQGRDGRMVCPVKGCRARLLEWLAVSEVKQRRVEALM